MDRRDDRARRNRRLPALLVLVIAPEALIGASGAAAGRGTVTCSPAQLQVVYLGTTSAAGRRAAEYGFQNTRTRCALVGYPRVQMLTAAGSKLATTQQHTPAGAFGIKLKRVELPHGAIAYFAIEYHAQTGYGKKRCPTSAAVQLTAPGTSTPKVLKGPGGHIAAYSGSILHLGCGVLAVSPVSARPFR